MPPSRLPGSNPAGSMPPPPNLFQSFQGPPPVGVLSATATGGSGRVVGRTAATPPPPPPPLPSAATLTPQPLGFPLNPPPVLGTANSTALQSQTTLLQQQQQQQQLLRGISGLQRSVELTPPPAKRHAVELPYRPGIPQHTHPTGIVGTTLGTPMGGAAGGGGYSHSANYSAQQQSAGLPFRNLLPPTSSAQQLRPVVPPPAAPSQLGSYAAVTAGSVVVPPAAPETRRSATSSGGGLVWPPK